MKQEKDWKLTCNEYCLLDIIFNLSKILIMILVLCFKTNLRNYIGVTEPTIFNLINKLEKRKIPFKKSCNKIFKSAFRLTSEVNLQNTKKSLASLKKVNPILKNL